jgi:L-xylulokinase
MDDRRRKAKTRTLYPHPGHIERDLDEFWGANALVIAQVIRLAKIDPSDIAGIAAAGYGSGLHLITEDGRPAWNGIISTDSRASAYVQQYYRDGTFARVLPKTCQSIWAAQPAALLPWFRDHRPDVLEKTRWILSCKDYIRFKLTGEPLCEVTDSTATSLVNIHSLVHDPELLNAFGISALRDKFPRIHKSGEICGRVTRAAAEQTGLKEGTPVAAGLFDVTACAIASGLIDPEMLCVIAGTWSINEYVSRKPVESPSLFMSSGYCMPGYWLIGEPDVASNLGWFVRAHAGGRGRPCRGLGSSRVQQARRQRRRSRATSPFCPSCTEARRAEYVVLLMHGWHTKAHLLRAVFEGSPSPIRPISIVMTYRDRVAAVASLERREVVDLAAVFADVLQLPVEVTATQELGARGAARGGGRRDVRLVRRPSPGW